MEIYTLLLGLNWFFIESGLNSAANPKESCKVETKIQSSYKDAVPGEKFGLSFAKGQKFPLTFELANLATTVGVRHVLVSLGAQQYYSGGCLVGETTVKGGMLFERVLIGYGPVGNISASSGLFIFLDMAR